MIQQPDTDYPFFGSRLLLALQMLDRLSRGTGESAAATS